MCILLPILGSNATHPAEKSSAIVGLLEGHSNSAISRSRALPFLSDLVGCGMAGCGCSCTLVRNVPVCKQLEGYD